MKDALKNFFLPTEENERVPVLLSYYSFAFLFALAAFLILSPAAIKQHQLAELLGGPTFEPADVIRLVNSDRAAAGLSGLKQNELLAQAAKAKAQDMIAKNYFAHTSPENVTPWDFIRAAGYSYSAAGENLAMDFATPESTESALMRSPTHRANILNNLYTEIGVSVAEGSYENHPSIFVVQYFGKPTNSIAQVPKIKDLSRAKELVKIPAAAKPTAAKNQAVLGTETGANVTADVSVRFVSFVVIFFLLVTLALSLLRLGALPFATLTRTFVLILIFGYIATNSVVLQEGAQITPVSFSTVTSLGR